MYLCIILRENDVIEEKKKGKEKYALVKLFLWTKNRFISIAVWFSVKQPMIKIEEHNFNCIGNDKSI